MNERDALAGVTCPGCGVVGSLQVVWRDRLRARPLGTFSLAGTGMKLSAVKEWIPWLTCSSEGCGFETAGTVER